MTYFTCRECGLMANISSFEASSRRDYCPDCEEETTWTTAFEADGEVSF